VDVHPSGSTSSSIYGISGAYQAGVAYFSGISHAAVWNGTAASFIDLHALLPPGFSESSAYGLRVQGDLIEVVGSAYRTSAMREEAIIWRGDLFPHRPLVRLIGRSRLSTARPSIVIRGRATDADGDLLKVEVKVGTRPYRAAKGTPARWRHTVPLKPGRNRVLVRAKDAAGAFSTPLRVLIQRL
jgi:hypothetical protein